MSDYTMKPGYAYRLAAGDYDNWRAYILDENAWEIVMVSEVITEHATRVGSIFLDGVDCAVFKGPRGGIYAQTKVYTRNN